MVTRYDSDIEYYGEGDFCSYMAERYDGDYVTYSDYLALEQELNDVKERIYSLYRSV